MADLPPFNVLGSASRNLPGVYPTNNYQAATNALALTPQEQALYMRHLQNLYGAGGVDNPDGSRSTLYQMGVGIGDRTYNMPTVYDGKILEPENALARARQIGVDSFPSYGSPFQAENRYTQMHDYMDRDTSDYMKGRGR